MSTSIAANGRVGANGKSKPASLNAYLLVPVLAISYGLIIYPLLVSSCDQTDAACLFAPRPENKVAWPLLAGIALILLAMGRQNLRVPRHIIALLVFVGFAGASVLWAFRPEFASIRYAQQLMIVIAVVLPPLIRPNQGDLMRGLFFCFALACAVNIFFVMGPLPKIEVNATPGYSGYFSGKNYLGICGAITLLLAMHEMMYPGLRRPLGLIVGIIAAYLLFLSNGKTALALAVLAPVLASLAMLLNKYLRLSVLFIPLAIVLGFTLASTLLGFNIYRLSYLMSGESTFTGRKLIWEFANTEFLTRPFLGWGYQSFWLVGADAPSVVEAPGWVKTMPDAHNGYIDTMLEMGVAGLVLLLIFVCTTVHAAGRMINSDPRRAWIVIALAFFVIATNGLESMWMRAFEFVWLVFLVLAAEIGRQMMLSRIAAPKTLPAARQMRTIQSMQQVSTSRIILPANTFAVSTSTPNKLAAPPRGELPSVSRFAAPSTKLAVDQSARTLKPITRMTRKSFHAPARNNVPTISKNQSPASPV